MRLLPRRGDDATSDQSADANVAAEPVDVPAARAPKGRPTPKRRDSEARRGPAAPAPKTRREAIARQKAQVKSGRSAVSTGAPLTAAQRRERMAAGDPAYVQRRDAGPLRALARDYVDSRRMLSNFMLLLLPLLLISSFLNARLINVVVIVFLFGVMVEWYRTGMKVLALAAERGIDAGRQKPFGLGFYAGNRAFMPPKWRMPRPRVSRGDAI